jgi:hypothetical protein
MLRTALQNRLVTEDDNLERIQQMKAGDMRILALTLLAGLILGCAPKSVPILEESMNECDRLVKMTERVYFDKSSEELLAAATRVFQLAGGGYAVTSAPDGLTAHRSWPPVAPAPDAVAPDGKDTWRVTVADVLVCKGGYIKGRIEAVEGVPVHGRSDDCGAAVPGVKLAAYHGPEIYSHGMVPSECFATPVFRPGVSTFTTTPALYDLFFLRLDYLLGKSGQWPTCASYSEYIRKNIYYQDQFSVVNFQGHLDGLCAQVQDLSP